MKIHISAGYDVVMSDIIIHLETYAHNLTAEVERISNREGFINVSDIDQFFWLSHYLSGDFELEWYVRSGSHAHKQYPCFTKHLTVNKKHGYSTSR